jgi:hypothetical protein
VEEESALAPDDVVLVELKRILLMRIAAFEEEEPNDAALPLAANPADESAVAVAVDLAISLLTQVKPASEQESTLTQPGDIG